MKRLICIVMIAFIMLNIVGCDLNNDPLRISYDLKVEPRNLDPQTAKDVSSLVIVNNVFEGLFSINKDGVAEKAIAKDYAISNNGLTYSFTLRDDVVWDDNNAKTKDEVVDAFDFEFAFQRLLGEDTNSSYAQLYYCIKNARQVHGGELSAHELGVKAISQFELKIELETPNSNFINMLAATCTMPCNKEFFENTNGKYGLEAYTILANGPFIISGWQHDVMIRLDKNDKYYDNGNVKTDSVSLWIKTFEDKDDESTSSNINKDNTVDRLVNEKTLAGFVDGFDIDKIDKKKFSIESLENTTYGIAFNIANKQLANKNVRLAIATAFDRSSYEPHLPDGITVANAIIPHGVMLENGKTFREYAGDNIVQKYDNQKAFEHYKTGLEELNRQKINGFSIMMMQSENINHSEYFLFVSQILQRELGVFIKVEMVDEATYNKRLKSGDFDCVLLELETANNTSRSVLEQFSTGNDKNYFKYSNNNVDQLLSQSAEQSDMKMVNEAYRSIESMIIDDAVFIPMCYKRDYLVCSKEISGLFYNKQTGLLYFKDVVRN